MSAPERLRALLAKPDFVVMPAVWDGLSAKLSAAAGYATAFLSGSCVAASRLGGPDLDLLSFAEMFDSFQMVRGAAPETLVLADGDHGYGNAMNVQRTVRASDNPILRMSWVFAPIREQLGEWITGSGGQHADYKSASQFLPAGQPQRLRPRPRRRHGPRDRAFLMARAGLDGDAVVAAAAVLADAEGLEAVTLARLAADAGVRPPSLYAHVATGAWASVVPHTWLRSIPLTGAARAVRLVEPETTAQISMAIHAGSGSVAARAFLNVAAGARLDEAFDLERRDFAADLSRP